MDIKKIKLNLYFTPFVKMIPDKLFLKLHYRISCRKKLDLKNPVGFNAKLQWLKLYFHRDIFTRMVDKYEVKSIVSDRIGEKYVIPTLGVWDKFEDIDWDMLPNQFVLKCTHDSGGLVICRDKSTLDIEAAKKKINKSLRRNYFYLGREWPYKNVPRRIIAEKYMENPQNENLDVYKVFTFSGEPRIIQTIQNDKTSSETIDYFDPQWNLLDMRQDYPNSEVPLKQPESLTKMLELARELSDGLPFVRIDFYEINGEVFFSEFTFYSDCGFARFTPSSWDNILGEWVILPVKEKEHE